METYKGLVFATFAEDGPSLDKYLGDFRWYLDLVKSGTTRPHAGYGIGNERLLQYVLGQEDIRTCSAFNIMGEQTNDWTPKTSMVK